MQWLARFLPKVALAMETILVPEGNQRFASSINSAAKVINIQVTTKRIIEGKKPYSAVATGIANIPAPIEVPLINNIAPINFIVIHGCNPLRKKFICFGEPAQIVVTRFPETLRDQECLKMDLECRQHL